MFALTVNSILASVQLKRNFCIVAFSNSNLIFLIIQVEFSFLQPLILSICWHCVRVLSLISIYFLFILLLFTPGSIWVAGHAAVKAMFNKQKNENYSIIGAWQCRPEYVTGMNDYMLKATNKNIGLIKATHYWKFLHHQVPRISDIAAIYFCFSLIKNRP